MPLDWFNDSSDDEGGDSFGVTTDLRTMSASRNSTEHHQPAAGGGGPSSLYSVSASGSHGRDGAANTVASAGSQHSAPTYLAVSPRTQAAVAAAATTITATMRVAGSSSSSTHANSVSHTDVPQELQVPSALPYPHDFWDVDTGSIPTTAEQAQRLWQYRRCRPEQGSLDNETPDGMKMLVEIQKMRERLKEHVERCFVAGAREMANQRGLLVPGTNSSPITEADLIHALGALVRAEGSLESETTAYLVCHHFHRPKAWLSQVVDSWCREEGVEIMYPQTTNVETGKKKMGPHSRGGFGSAARHFKDELVKKIRRNMLRKAGWEVCTKKQDKQSKQKGLLSRKFEQITVQVADHASKLLVNKTCFVVTYEQVAGGEAEDSCGTASRVGTGSTPSISSNNPISAHEGYGRDLATHILSQLGINVDQSKVEEIVGSYRPPRLTESMVGREIIGHSTVAGDSSEITQGTTAPNILPHNIHQQVTVGGPSDGQNQMAGLTSTISNNPPNPINQQRSVGGGVNSNSANVVNPLAMSSVVDFGNGQTHAERVARRDPDSLPEGVGVNETASIYHVAYIFDETISLTCLLLY